MAQKVLTLSAGGAVTEAANAGELAFTPVNKAGDTGVGAISMGKLTSTTDSSVTSAETSSANGTSFMVYNTTNSGDRVAAVRLANGSNQWNIRAVGAGDNFFIGPGASGAETNYLTISSAGAATFSSTVSATTVKARSAGGYISSDNSTGITTTVTTASLVGKTITIKDGIITGFA